MRKFVITAAVTALGATFAGNALAADAGPSSGVEVGLRAGYGIPMGSATGADGADQSKFVKSLIPIQLDALYMINPNIRVGIYAMYGFGSAGDQFNQTCQGGVSCSLKDMRFGVQAHYHFMPDQTIDPWVGLGVGYEIGSFSASANGQDAGVSFSGLEFLNIQGGADYKVMPNLGVGPFAMFSLGQYGSCSFSGALSSQGDCKIDKTAMHEWLTIGIRGAYDIGF